MSVLGIELGKDRGSRSAKPTGIPVLCQPNELSVDYVVSYALCGPRYHVIRSETARDRSQVASCDHGSRVGIERIIGYLLAHFEALNQPLFSLDRFRSFARSCIEDESARWRPVFRAKRIDTRNQLHPYQVARFGFAVAFGSHRLVTMIAKLPTVVSSSLRATMDASLDEFITSSAPRY